MAFHFPIFLSNKLSVCCNSNMQHLLTAQWPDSHGYGCAVTHHALLIFWYITHMLCIHDAYMTDELQYSTGTLPIWYWYIEWYNPVPGS